MTKKNSIRLIAIILFGGLLFLGLGTIASGSALHDGKKSSETTVHYKLPQFIPTTWIGRQ